MFKTQVNFRHDPENCVPEEVFQTFVKIHKTPLTGTQYFKNSSLKSVRYEPVCKMDVFGLKGHAALWNSFPQEQVSSNDVMGTKSCDNSVEATD